jgi:hypothetical protein
VEQFIIGVIFGICIGSFVVGFRLGSSVDVRIKAQTGKAVQSMERIQIAAIGGRTHLAKVAAEKGGQQ